MTRRIIFFVPSDRPVGGIAKVLDYAVHAARLHFDVVFCMQNADKNYANGSLFQKPYFRNYARSIALCTAAEFEPQAEDVLFFTLPSSHNYLSRMYAAAGIMHPTFIHLLQNVRVANIAFDNGFSFRLLSKPMHRICITQEVVDAVAPFVEDTENLSLIPHGFDFENFERKPVRDDPIVLNFNMFKGDFGHKVNALVDKTHVKGVKVVKRGVSWTDLRSSYLSSSVFIATPLPEEGLYLPALEAMAAGHAVITSDAYGNRFYCDFDENCCLVPFEDVAAYVDKVNWLIENWEGAAFEMRQKAYEKAKTQGLDGEYKLFSAELERYRT